jgi:hypothetical protein
MEHAMQLLNWQRKPQFDDGDRNVISRRMAGTLPASLFGDHTARVNWGYLNRALRRGFASGEIVAYTLLKNGEMSVTWFVRYTHKPISTAKISVDDTPNTPSCIPDMPRSEKKLLTDEHYAVKIGRNCKVERYDSVRTRKQVEDTLKRDQEVMHGAEGESERRHRPLTGAGNMWGYKFKHNGCGGYNVEYFSDVARHCTSEEVLQANRKRRGAV